MNPSSRRALLLLLLLFVFSGIAGALLAPPLFQLKGQKEGFDQFTVNCITLVMAAGSLALLKRYGMKGPAAVGFPAERKGLPLALAGMFLGCLSVLLLYLGGRAGHVFRFAFSPENGVLQNALRSLWVALWVGILEEALFRGVVFGVLRKNSGFWASAMLSSLVFSAVHFLMPAGPGEGGSLRWWTGLQFLFRAEIFTAPPGQMIPFALTLFLMGLSLCLFYEKNRSLYLSLGLHAGWVWGFTAGRLLFDRNSGRLSAFFGPLENISRSYAALCLTFVFFIAGLWFSTRARKRQ